MSKAEAFNLNIYELNKSGSKNVSLLFLSGVRGHEESYYQAGMAAACTSTNWHRHNRRCLCILCLSSSFIFSGPFSQARL